MPRKSAAQSDRNDANLDFWTEALPILSTKTSLFRSMSPRTGPYLSVSNNAFHHQLWVKSDSCHIQLRIDSGDLDENDAYFDEIQNKRQEIEERFGAELTWNRAENHRACIIRFDIPGSAGWKTEPVDRAAGLVAMADSVVRFADALEPVLRTME